MLSNCARPMKILLPLHIQKLEILYTRIYWKPVCVCDIIIYNKFLQYQSKSEHFFKHQKSLNPIVLLEEYSGKGKH